MGFIPSDPCSGSHHVGCLLRGLFGWTLTPPDDVRVAWTLGPWDNERVPFSDTPTGLIGVFVAGLGPSSDGVMLCIYVDDIEEVLREIDERGCEIVEPVHLDRGAKVAMFRDPGRNVIGLWEVDAEWEELCAAAAIRSRESSWSTSPIRKSPGSGNVE